MNSAIKRLIDLQKMESEIQEKSHTLQQIPKKEKLIDKRVSAEKQALIDAEAEVETSDRERKKLEILSTDTRERMKTLKKKMPTIKSNEEYSALLRELDNSQKIIDDAEERVLFLLEKIDELKKTFPEKEDNLKKKEAEIASERESIQKEKIQLEKEILDLKKDRQKIVGEISPDWLSIYNHIASQRGGKAIVQVVGVSCGGCNMEVRPKVLQDIKMSEDIIYCENCHRILFFEEEK